MSIRGRNREFRRPELVAAELALGRLEGPAAEAVPADAAWWIVEGHDLPDVVSLAALSGDDTDKVRMAVYDALAALGVALPSTGEAVRVVVLDLARRCLDGHIGERAVASEAWDIYVASGYADATLDEPLGSVAQLDDEWGAEWARADAELVAETRSACGAQLRVPGR